MLKIGSDFSKAPRPLKPSQLAEHLGCVRPHRRRLFGDSRFGCYRSHQPEVSLPPFVENAFLYVEPCDFEILRECRQGEVELMRQSGGEHARRFIGDWL